jgi:hypothetical protein
VLFSLQNQEEIDQLVKKLEGKDLKARDKAAEQLVEIGRPAEQALKKFLKEGKGVEAKKVAERALHEIEWGKGERAVRDYQEEHNKNRESHLIEVTEERSLAETIQETFPSSRFFYSGILPFSCMKTGCKDPHPIKYLVIRKYDEKLYMVDDQLLIEFCKSAEVKLADTRSIDHLLGLLFRVASFESRSGKAVGDYDIKKEEGKDEVEFRVALSGKNSKPHIIIRTNKKGEPIKIEYRNLEIIEKIKGGMRTYRFDE